MDILKGLVRFARKEKIELCAVIEGSPLRHAPDKQKFQDSVLVRYAANSAGLTDTVLAVMRSNNRYQNITVITSDKMLEKKTFEQGGQVMRGATFKKALEGTGVELEESKSQGPKRRGGSGGGQNQRRQRKPASGKQQDANGQRRKSKKTEDDPVRDLIDLVEEKPKAPRADKQPPAQGEAEVRTDKPSNEAQPPREIAVEPAAAPIKRDAEQKPETAEAH
ncbi:MAG: hypothetical protein EOM20_13510 [Spartobacteria bacterium]|nr:hypothetical protein [Spartobacteria bacterium]